VKKNEKQVNTKPVVKNLKSEAVERLKPVRPRPKVDKVTVSLYPLDFQVISDVEEVIRGAGFKGTTSRALHVVLRIIRDNTHLISEDRVASIV
jgi:hypothetical protein